jgi:hypothetical protein
MMRLGVVLSGLLIASADGTEEAPAPRPAITIRLAHADQQLERLLALFNGSRAPHPAAALAAWKRATGGRGSLGKRREAIIALFNPEMIPELRTLDGAEIVVGFDPKDGHLRWSATLPHDDGTFAALATAWVLSGGGADPPLEGVAVDRLGPPGSPVMARTGSGLVAAGSRSDLRAALARTPTPATIATGLQFRVDPQALAEEGPLPRRLTAALRALNCRAIAGQALLEQDCLRVVWESRFAGPPPGSRSIDPSWLDLFPAERALAVFAIAIDPKPETWDLVFAVADRVERADPARAGVAPLRTRLNLIALAAGVRPEVELWPKLIGISGGLFVGPSHTINGGLLALHTTDPAAAARLAQRAWPRWISTVLGPVPDPIGIAQRASTLLITWGDRPTPADHSVAALLPSQGQLHRFAALWPGRWPNLPASPLTTALADSPPLLWCGDRVGPHARDSLTWTGLRATIQRLLNLLPLAPPS